MWHLTVVSVRSPPLLFLACLVQHDRNPSFISVMLFVRSFIPWHPDPLIIMDPILALTAFSEVGLSVMQCLNLKADESWFLQNSFVAQASTYLFQTRAATMVVAEMMACHAPPLWILIILMLSWTVGIMHEHVSWLHYVNTSEQCWNSNVGGPVLLCEDNDFTECFSGAAAYSSAMRAVTWNGLCLTVFYLCVGMCGMWASMAFQGWAGGVFHRLCLHWSNGYDMPRWFLASCLH